jgi:hypothetical protein
MGLNKAVINTAKICCWQEISVCSFQLLLAFSLGIVDEGLLMTND